MAIRRLVTPSTYRPRHHWTGDGAFTVIARWLWLADGMLMGSGYGVYPMGSAPHGIHTVAPPCHHRDLKPQVRMSAKTGSVRLTASLSKIWTVRRLELG